MSCGKFHDKTTVYALVPLMGLCWALTDEISQCLIFAFGFLFGGFMFGPDLDTYSIQYKRWGLLRFIWIPYQRLGGHRSFITQSHDLLLGTLIRIVYLFVIFACLFFFGFSLIKIFCPEIIKNLTEKACENERTLTGSFNSSLSLIIILFFVGVWLGNALHIFADWASSLKKFALRTSKK